MTHPASQRLCGLFCAFAAVVLLASTDGATARPLSDLTATDRTNLTEALDAFLTATAQGQAERVVDVMPPRLLAVIAAQHRIEPDALRRAMVGEIRKMHDGGLRETGTFDVTRADIETLPDGTLYALVPIHISVKGGARDVESDGRTLALAERGGWYLVDISSEERLQTFRRAYPDFAGVDPGPKTIETKP